MNSFIFVFVFILVFSFLSVCLLVSLFSVRKSNMVLKVTTTKKYTQSGVTPNPHFHPFHPIPTNPTFSTPFVPIISR